MELIQRILLRGRQFGKSHEQRVEFDARCLVQKLAREEAANRAVTVARLQGDGDISRLERTARNARILRDTAQVILRRELGLSEFPTAVEIADWGRPPVAPVRSRNLPITGEIG